MKVGDRVRVSKSISVYHHPDHKGQPFELKGSEGEIQAIVNELDGKPISANYKFLVKFTKKFRAHLHEDEFEVLS